MFVDPDTDEDVYADQRDVTCPNCGHTEDLVVDALGSYSRRNPHQIIWYFVCDKCDHEWEWDEDLTDN
jgi:hypothetical protein